MVSLGKGDGEKAPGLKDDQGFTISREVID